MGEKRVSGGVSIAEARGFCRVPPAYATLRTKAQRVGEGKKSERKNFVFFRQCSAGKPELRGGASGASAYWRS
jgi:hypothetical protein